MPQVSRSICTCLLAAVMGVGSLAAPSRAAESAVAFSTPRQTWDAYRRALDAEKFAEAFDLLTPAAQEERLQQCILGSVMLLEQLPDAPKVPKEFIAYRDRLQALLRVHGIDAKELFKAYNAVAEKASRAGVEPTEQQSRKLPFYQFKGDRRNFVAEAARLQCELQRAFEKYRKASAGAAEPPEAEGDGKRKGEVLRVNVKGDRAVMVVRALPPEDQVAESGGLVFLYMNLITPTQYFRQIGKRWFIASETGEPVHAPFHALKQSSLPYTRQFDMDCGDALRFELPNGREVAFWCSGTPTGVAFGTQIIGLGVGRGFLMIEFGEKPFIQLASKICEYYPEGAAGWDSYIWQGGEETFSSTGLGRQRELFVGEYRILADENVGKEGKLSLTVTVRAATAAEQLYGAPARALSQAAQIGLFDRAAGGPR